MDENTIFIILNIVLCILMYMATSLFIELRRHNKEFDRQIRESDQRLDEYLRAILKQKRGE